MLLTITTTHAPASDLGFLLHKNPARGQSFDASFGRVHVFYPEVSESRCTAALLLDIDPVKLVRGTGGAESGPLDQYVNDRPYVASSFLSVAISTVYGSALAGKSRERPELAAIPIPLLARIAVIPCRGGEPLLRSLFEPLGYAVEAVNHPQEDAPGDSSPSLYFTVTLSATKPLHEMLTHLYVLIPVLDDRKHYAFGDDEIEKLLRHGAGWLEAHPQRDMIALRYLRHRRSLVDEAIERLSADEGREQEDADEPTLLEPISERTPSLNEQRLSTVLAALKSVGAKRVIDLGCGEGRLLSLLLADRAFEEILGMDVSYRALEIASRRLRLDGLAPKQRERIRLQHGSLTYRDARLTGFDAAAVVEVIEHLDPPRLAAFERVLFEFARPSAVVLTTPNADYNVRWETLPAGEFRHADHRFEWSREEFQGWAGRIAEQHRFDVRFVPVGVVDPDVGSPTQMAIFTRRDDG